MSAYPSGNWETDLEIPQDFIDDFNSHSIAAVDTKIDLRNRLAERLFITWFYAKEAQNLPGDFVECGVFHGQTAYFMAKNCNTTLHLFDSWNGSGNVGEFDNKFYAKNTFTCSVEDAQSNLSEFNNISFHNGEVPFEFDAVTSISFLHLDMNLYEPTKIALENLWDKVVPGGFVIVDYHDDYSIGAKKATEDFFAQIEKEITALSTGKALITK